MFKAVTVLNQLTFQLATGYVSNGRAVYHYAVPEVDANITLWPIPFTKWQPGVGRDANRGDMGTNVNTLVVELDCRTVVTSHPGLPSGMAINDPRIYGTAVYGYHYFGPLIP